jgi:cytochrome P450 family 144
VLANPDRLAGSQLIEDPYPLYARLRQEAPVWQVPGTEVFFVSTWKLVAEAVARVDDFTNHFRHALFSEEDGSIGLLNFGTEGTAPDVFAGADPPAPTIHRKLFSPEFMQKKMLRLESQVSALADALLDRLLVRGRGDVTTKLANPLPMRIMAEHVIGFRDPDAGQLQQWVFAGSRLMGGRVQLGEMASIADDASGLHPWVKQQLDQALTSPGADGVLSATAAGVRDGVLTHDEATFTLMVFLGAGGETTTSLIGNAIRILSEHPELQDQVRANPSAVPVFLEEMLRLESPFRFHPRTAQRAVELGGVPIPERAMVALLWGAANRDGSVFERPDEIRLDRANAQLQVGFGRGIHYCVGAPLARLESRIVLQRLLERTSHFSLDGNSPPRWADSLWMRRHESLPIVVDPA